MRLWPLPRILDYCRTQRWRVEVVDYYTGELQLLQGE